RVLAFGAEASEHVWPVLADHDPVVRLRPRRSDLIDVRHRVPDRPVVNQEQAALRVLRHAPCHHHVVSSLAYAAWAGFFNLAPTRGAVCMESAIRRLFADFISFKTSRAV